jgi:hypothetical protein
MKKSNILTCLGATGHSLEKRQKEDYYATEPKAIDLLFDKEEFDEYIWECACGEGHLSIQMIKHDKRVYSTDLIDRGFGVPNFNFLEKGSLFAGDIITNPPYKYALDFIKKSLECVNYGNKVAMFLKLTFLEGKKRKEFFKENPPKKIYVCSGRVNCAKNGEFEKYPSSATAYAWFVWEKGHKGETVIDWIN